MELADQPDQPLADQHVVDQPDAAGTVDHQRHHRLGEDDIGPQGQERQPVTGFDGDALRSLQDQRWPLALVAGRPPSASLPAPRGRFAPVVADFLFRRERMDCISG